MATFRTEIFQPEWKDGENSSTTRTIGLELELVVSNKRCALHRETLAKKIGGFTNMSMDEYMEKIQVKNLFPGIGFDGNDLEFVTNPDSITLYREGGSERFKKAMAYLKRNTVGGKRAINSGTHINVGKLENENVEYTLDNAFWICMNFATQLQKIAGRISRWAMFPTYTGQRQYFKSSQFEGASKVQSTKIAMQKAPFGHNKQNMLVNKQYVYEFRLFKASNKIEEVIAWVELCHNIINLASGEKEMDRIYFSDLIIGKYIEEYVAKLKGKRKLTADELDASINNTLSFECYRSDETIIL